MSGTIPAELANLARLKQLQLGINFMQGTIGDWIGSLANLEVLSVGANAGVNEANADGDELTGIIGTIPRTISKLKHLVELDFQVRGDPLADVVERCRAAGESAWSEHVALLSIPLVMQHGWQVVAAARESEVAGRSPACKGFNVVLPCSFSGSNTNSTASCCRCTTPQWPSCLFVMHGS